MTAAVMSLVAVSLCALQGEQPKNAELRFEVLTALTSQYRFSCDMMASAVHNNIPLHVVGWGSKALKVNNRKEREGKLKQKIALLHEYVQDWDDDVIMTFIDGGDVLFQGGLPEIRAGYSRVATQQRPIVFSAERNCFIKSLPKSACVEWPRPANSPYRYLNSGAWSGPIKQVKPLLEYALSTFNKFDPRVCKRCGDQAVFGHAYIRDGWNASIALDHRTDLYVNLFESQHDFRCNKGSTTGRWKTCPTNRVAPIVHFNGNPKHPQLLPKLWISKMFWSKRLLPRDARIRINGKLTPLLQLCPQLSFAEASNSTGSNPEASPAPAVEDRVDEATNPAPQVARADSAAQLIDLAEERPERPAEYAAVDFDEERDNEAWLNGLEKLRPERPAKRAATGARSDRRPSFASTYYRGEKTSATDAPPRRLLTQVKNAVEDEAFVFGCLVFCACLTFFFRRQYKAMTVDVLLDDVSYAPHDCSAVTRRSPKYCVTSSPDLSSNGLA